jgi:hypothetical protein
VPALFGAIVRATKDRDARDIIPTAVVKKSLRKFRLQDGGIPQDRLDQFLADTFPPEE